MDFDVIYIGSGHACWHGALILLRAGKKVAFAEHDVVGGTCTNYGCDAKIVLDGPFEYLSGLSRYRGLCVDGEPQIDWSRLMAYKEQQIAPLSVGMEQGFTRAGFTFLKGETFIKDAHTVTVDGKDYTTEYIVVGTGQRDEAPNIPGREYLHTSREFLSIKEMPRRLVFIGAGVISMEFASMALLMGRQVTIIEFADRALLTYPEKYVEQLVRKMEAQGAAFRFGEGVKEAAKTDGGYLVRTSGGFEVEADYILSATGRAANVEGLGLEALGVETSRRGVKVNACLQTAVPNIYASGDVVDKVIPRLTPTAEFESNYIAGHILGNPAPIVYPAVPNLTFTLPRIAQVGVSVAEAEKEPDRYRLANIPYGRSMLWLAKNDPDLDITVIFDQEGCLVGAAAYGDNAGMFIDVLTIIIGQKIKGEDLRKLIFAFPTETYGLLSPLSTMF